MRIAVSALCVVFFAVSPVSAREGPFLEERKPLALRIAESPIDPDTDPRMFLSRYRLEADPLSVRSWKGEKWFKPAVIAYWIGAAVKSYLDDDGFKLRSRVVREPTVSASFQMERTGRAIFVPRSTPLLVFPLEHGKSIDRLWMVHVTSGGAVVTYAFSPRH